MSIRSAGKAAMPLPPRERPRPHIVDLPAAVGVRLLCLSLLDDAAAAHARVGVHDDPEALHDFRVALRRLRSTIRAYDALLDDSVGGKLRKLLRRVARSTGASRDLEVHIDWLSKVAAVPTSSVDVAQALVHRLEQRKEEADEAMQQEVGDFDRLRRRMASALARYQGTIDPSRPLGDTTGEAAAARVIQLTTELESHLAAVKTIEDQEQAHESRIAAKRVRYVAEPFRKQVPGAKELVDSLKELQTVLGDLHDLHTLLVEMDAWVADAAKSEDSAWHEAVERLRAEVHRQRDLLYAKTRADWLEGHAEALFEQARSVAAALRSQGAPPPVEIERKFVLRAMPRLRGRSVDVQRIEQGYLPGSIVTERIRSVRDSSGTRYFRTIKTGEGIMRGELEEETTEQLFRQLWPLTKGRRIRKRRYKVEDGTLTWEIDRFDHIDLVVAEVELPAADTPVVPPPWLRRYLEREVTGDPEFLNVNLAR